eukprot:8360965-Prorocentrum_lima.AAC.1
MTSSLVGSEMCIRDSYGGELEISGVDLDHEEAVQEAASSGSLPPKPPPVSYTHLTLPTICSV